MDYINLNGKIMTADKAGIPVDNGAFRYGYGLFETMVVINGAIRLAGYHWERLFAGLKLLQLDTPALHTPQWLERQTLDTVARNKADNLCRVRLQYFAGGGGLYGANAVKPGFIIECFELNEEAIAFNENGLTLGVAEGLAKSKDMLSNVKSCNALIYAMGARQAKAEKCNDMLLRNTAGNLRIMDDNTNYLRLLVVRIYAHPTHLPQKPVYFISCPSPCAHACRTQHTRHDRPFKK